VEKLRIQGGFHPNRHDTGFSTLRCTPVCSAAAVHDNLQNFYNLPAIPRPDPHPRDLTPICRTIPVCDSSLTLYRYNKYRTPSKHHPNADTGVARQGFRGAVFHNNRFHLLLGIILLLLTPRDRDLVIAGLDRTVPRALTTPSKQASNARTKYDTEFSSTVQEKISHLELNARMPLRPPTDRSRTSFSNSKILPLLRLHPLPRALPLLLPLLRPPLGQNRCPSPLPPINLNPPLMLLEHNIPIKHPIPLPPMQDVPPIPRRLNTQIAQLLGR